MDSATRERIRERAKHRCEYCLLPEAATPFVPFHVEHIIAKQHMEDNSQDNLALACDRCNAFKGTNLSSVDPDSGEIVTLFHPRQDIWSDHFVIDQATIAGKSPKGRATVNLLQFNAKRRVELRQSWLRGGGLFQD